MTLSGAYSTNELVVTDDVNFKRSEQVYRLTINSYRSGEFYTLHYSMTDQPLPDFEWEGTHTWEFGVTSGFVCNDHRYHIGDAIHVWSRSANSGMSITWTYRQTFTLEARDRTLTVY